MGGFSSTGDGDGNMSDVLREIKAEFPAWYVWRGADPPGFWYARRPLMSPPLTARAAKLGGLRAAILAAAEAWPRPPA